MPVRWPSQWGPVMVGLCQTRAHGPYEMNIATREALGQAGSDNKRLVSVSEAADPTENDPPIPTNRPGRLSWRPPLALGLFKLYFSEAIWRGTIVPVGTLISWAASATVYLFHPRSCRQDLVQNFLEISSWIENRKILLLGPMGSSII